MKKKDWTLVVGLVFAVWGIDQATKWLALETIKMFQFYGPIGLVLHRNPGAMLGMFSDLPPVLRIVSLSTGGAFLIFIYAAIQYMLPTKSLILRAGMSILLGGILGNVTDRIIAGSVVDFLVLGTRQFSTPAFNFADAIQWVGYFMIVYVLIKDGKQIWPVENVRKQVWVNPHFQLKYIFLLVGIGIGFSIISGVCSYTYLKVTIDDLVVGRSQAMEERFLTPFLFTFSIISLSFLMVLIMIGRILSHRTAGPLYAFEIFLDDVLSGKDRAFKLRAGDEFTHLEELGEKIRYKLRAHYKRHTPEADSSDEEEDAEPVSLPEGDAALKTWKSG